MLCPSRVIHITCVSDHNLDRGVPESGGVDGRF